MAEYKSEKADREAEELRLKLKSMAEEESDFTRKMASGRHIRRGGA